MKKRVAQGVGGPSATEEVGAGNQRKTGRNGQRSGLLQEGVEAAIPVELSNGKILVGYGYELDNGVDPYAFGTKIAEKIGKVI